MAHVFHEVTEPFAIEQMFALVNDIASYPEFVPDCRAASVIENQGDRIKACVDVEKMGFKKSFTTLNRLTPPYTIDMQLVAGPFSHLSGQWKFTKLTENSCKISLNLDFEFKNRLLNVAFTPIFKEVISNMVNAFSKRARQIY